MSKVKRVVKNQGDLFSCKKIRHMFQSFLLKRQIGIVLSFYVMSFLNNNLKCTGKNFKTIPDLLRIYLTSDFSKSDKEFEYFNE